MGLYETLGVAHDATPADIKAAYRKKAQASHPDRAGGDAEVFRQVQVAHDVLIDPERRSRYDATGQFGAVPDNRQVILAEVASMLMQLIDNVDIEHTDLIARAVKQYEDLTASHENQRADHRRKIALKQEALGRFECGEERLIATMIEAAIRNHEDIITQISAVIDRNAEAIELLRAYSYRVDPESTSFICPMDMAVRNQHQNAARYQSWFNGNTAGY